MLQNKPNVINNKKALLCSRAFLQRLDHSGQQNPVYLNSVNLLKFFPKYIHQLETEVSTGIIISKVKRVKILHAFEGYQSRSGSKNLRRTLLYNKEKHIQAFSDFDGAEFQDYKYIIHEIRAFTRLRSLRILSESHSSFALKRICQYMRGLYHLEHLEFKTNSEGSMCAISTIDSYKRLLESLITLKIDCKWRFKEEVNLGDNIDLFKSLARNKNMLKATTSLKLGSLDDQTFYDLFENTVTSCPKLIFLAFETDSLFPEDDLQKNNPIESHYLRALENLNHLQSVDILCRNIFTFLRDFALPPSIQNAKLTFSDFDVSMSLLDKSNNWNFSEIFASFCEKWSHLTNLKTLDVAFSQRSRFWPLTLDFLQSWLKQIHNIQNLEVELSSENACRSHWSKVPIHEGTFDVSVFLQSIQHLRGTLQTLVLSDNWLEHSIKNLPKAPLDFPHLRKLCLRGFIHPEEVDASQLFEINLKELLKSKDEQREPFEIVLEGLEFDSVNSFVNFMKSFDHERSEIKRSVKMNMRVYVKSEVPSNFFDRSTRFFIFQARGLSIRMGVCSNGKFEPENDPKILLGNNLSFLRLQD